MNNLQKSAPKFPARLIMTTPAHVLAFGFGSGLSPKAPGTVGTLVSLPLWWLLASCVCLPWQVYATVLAIVCLVGWWACARSSHLLGVHDHPGIVIDEFAGMGIAAIPLLPVLGWMREPHWLWWIAAFALFRLFDILKPWPIKALDRNVGGGFGIMIDDVLAGIFAAAILALALIYLPVF